MKLRKLEEQLKADGYTFFSASSRIMTERVKAPYIVSEADTSHSVLLIGKSTVAGNRYVSVVSTWIK